MFRARTENPATPQEAWRKRALRCFEEASFFPFGGGWGGGGGILGSYQSGETVTAQKTPAKQTTLLSPFGSAQHALQMKGSRIKQAERG